MSVVQHYILLLICLLNIHQYNVAGSVPLRSSTSLSRVVVSKRRIKVPFCDAEATTLPGWFKAKQAISLWWALIVNGADDVPGFVFERSYEEKINKVLMKCILIFLKSSYCPTVVFMANRYTDQRESENWLLMEQVKHILI